MPTNLVKTERDERLWSKAKQICREQGLDDSDADRFYRCVNGLYQKMQGKGGGTMPAYDGTGPYDGAGPMMGRQMGMQQEGQVDEEALRMAENTCREQGLDESDPETFQQCVVGMYRRFTQGEPAEAGASGEALRRWATSY